MTTYVDSSALVPLYVPERFSKAARRAILKAAQVPYTPLHHLEVLNAFALLRGRGLIVADEHRAIQRQLQEDLDVGRLVAVPLDWEGVLAGASDLSAAYTAQFLTRSLDLMHVASAMAHGCTVFVSADDRQLAVAKASGLKVVDIKRSQTSSK